MNLQQFKSWFEGFTENISGTPTKAQWSRIKERVGEITADPMSHQVFIDRYVRPYPGWWYGDHIWCSNTGGLKTTSNQLSMTADNGVFVSAGALEAKQLT